MNIILNSITFVSLGRKLQDDKNVHTALFVCLFVCWLVEGFLMVPKAEE
jgi:hypothetical protein